MRHSQNSGAFLALWCDSSLTVSAGHSHLNWSSILVFLKHGKFTVRSCYYYILSHHFGHNIFSLGVSSMLSVAEWKWLWRIQLQPKIQTFIWRAYNNIIPVRVSLKQRQLGWGGGVHFPLYARRVWSADHTLFSSVEFSRIFGRLLLLTRPLLMLFPTSQTVCILSRLTQIHWGLLLQRWCVGGYGFSKTNWCMINERAGQKI